VWGVLAKYLFNPQCGDWKNSPTVPLSKLNIKETRDGLISLYLEGANLTGFRFKTLGSGLIKTTTHRITQVYNNDTTYRNGFINFIRGGDNSCGGNKYHEFKIQQNFRFRAFCSLDLGAGHKLIL